MHEIIIPMVPSKNLIGRSGWWRNSHNDRVVWRARVKEAVAGRDLDLTAAYGAHVTCDWQARSRPWNAGDGVRREFEAALSACGLNVKVNGLTLAQSGRGQGETRIYLEPA